MSPVKLQRISAYDSVAHEAAVEVIQKAFLPRESACVASGITESQQAVRELCDLVRVVLTDGVSVAAYQGDTMVGVSVNKVQVMPTAGVEPFFAAFRNERTSDPRAQWLIDFMLQVDAMCDLFEVAGGDPILEVMFLAVMPDSGARGVGLQLVTEALEVARETEARGVSAIFTSDRSRAIGRRLGFQELAVAEHSELTFEGKPASEKLEDFQQRSVLVLFKL